MNEVDQLREKVKSLEQELNQYKEWNDHLQLQIKKRAPIERKGKTKTAKWEVRLDEKRNVFYIKLQGRFDYNTAKRVSHDIINILFQTRKGIILVNDISDKNLIVEPKASFHVRKMVYYFLKFGLKRVIRIVHPEYPQIFQFFNDQFSKVSKEVSIPISIACSLKEAESIIDREI